MKWSPSFRSGPTALLVPQLMLLGVALAVPGGCSHDQPPAAETPLALTRGPASEARAAARAARPSPSHSHSQEPPPASDDPAIFFDFDSAELRDEAAPALQQVADRVRARQDAKVRVEGNCDPLGTTEYNLALGEHRARAAKDYLIRLGIRPERIATVSYGAERPKYPGLNDDARAKNRRDDLVIR
jgi:peptidoglycan-associated lipoprotein